MKNLLAGAVVSLLLAAAGCGNVTSNGDAAATGGNGGSVATGGSPGTGGSGQAGQGGVRVCGPSATCARCNNGACCGSTCCAAGEWCDTSGTAPVCRCGTGNACMDGNTCASPLGGPNQCGAVCCQGGNCPISRRAFKREVHQLNAQEVQRVYGQLRDIKLTTYRYKDEPASDAPRLGFIIDDTASPYPINPDGNSVNLYGYASMAVAAIQAQSQEIAALKAEVARLSRQVRAARAVDNPGQIPR
ncbi:MAG: hypothetical protein ABUR63_09740 [Verrucomicrobiota bacterium]